MRLRVRSLDDLEIAWQRCGSAKPKGAHHRSLGQREGIPDGVVVESAGQQHAGFGVGQLGDQTHRQRRRIDHRQRGRELVFRVLARMPGRVFRRVGQRRQPLALGIAAVGVGRDRTRHHRAARQHTVQRLPGQVIADVQPVQPVCGVVCPRADNGKHQDQQRDGCYNQPRHQLATRTLAPDAATVS